MTASAGSGKTSVLTNRVVRLLLENVPPSQILCITYTKAAAAEMLGRVRQKLAQWATMTPEELQSDVSDMLGDAATLLQTQRARGLFAKVMEAEEGLRIHTIHAFCQSMLQRFPLEAGVSPHFNVLDERQSRELMAEVKEFLLSGIYEAHVPQEKLPALREAMAQLIEIKSESALVELLNGMITDRAKFQAQLQPYGHDWQRLKQDVWAQMKLPQDMTRETLFTAQLLPLMQRYDVYAKVLELLAEANTATDKKTADCLKKFLRRLEQADMNVAQRDFFEIFIKQDGDPFDRLYTTKYQKSDPALHEQMKNIQEKLVEYLSQLSALEMAECTQAALIVADTLLSEYERRKKLRGALDYDDQILQCQALLQRSSAAAWVQYKLDGGISHILLDEAQDTSPAQWDVLMPMIREFFSGEGQRSYTRTLFVVGDEKQSIYSFQGARPEMMQQKREEIAALAAAAGTPLKIVPMSQSFRSAPEILNAVDMVFANEWPKAGAALSEKQILHSTTRKHAKGKVVVWPVVQEMENDENEDIPTEQEGLEITGNFSPPRYQSRTNAKRVMAQKVAQTIKGWIDQGVVLPSTGKPIHAGDILILLRHRGAVLREMIKELKRAGVAVAGADRLEILEEIAVQDMLALARFALLPADDYSLACVLKSPLFGWSEALLQRVAFDRAEHSLWQRMGQLAQSDEEIAATYQQLSNILARVDYLPPHALFTYVLENLGGWKKMQQRLGEACVDPLQELLNLAYDYAQEHVGSMLGFLEMLVQMQPELKRESGESSHEVRVMTVHHSKGLQAPVVIIPDAMSEIPHRNSLNVKWYWNSAGQLMLPATAQGRQLPSWQEAKEASLEAEKREECRLLYVAMTRAQDYLYVSGTAGTIKEGSNAKPKTHWYGWIWDGLQTQLAPQACVGGDVWEGEMMVLGEGNEEVSAPSSEKTVLPAVPDWIFEVPTGASENAVKRLVASQTDEEKVAAGKVFSPLMHEALMKRGVVIHQLLQALPSVAEDAQELLAQRLLQRLAPEWPVEEKERALQQIFTILQEPPFGLLFSAASRAEVPVVGHFQQPDGSWLELVGQVDRLVVTEKEVWIVDYKTNQHVAKDAADVPRAYHVQMARYASILKHIYPRHTIRTAILYTAGPRWIELTAEQAMAA